MNYDLLSSIGLELSQNEKQQFDKYIAIFKNYNSHTNLISKNDEKVLFEKHIYDSLAFNLFAKKYKIPENIMDIGTGGGFPSVPVSLIFKNTKIYAVDSTSKKINFINEVKKQLNIENIMPVVSRIEELPEENKTSFDVVTSRALGTLSLLLEYAIPYLKVGGYFVAYKSVDSDNELMTAKNAMKVLHAELIDVIEYKLPLEINFCRKLLIFKKIADTPFQYPRKYNIIKNNPL